MPGNQPKARRPPAPVGREGRSQPAPAGTPAAIVKALGAKVAEFKQQPETQKRFAEQGAENIESSPDHFRAFIRREVQQWKKVLKPADGEPS